MEFASLRAPIVFNRCFLGSSRYYSNTIIFFNNPRLYSNENRLTKISPSGPPSELIPFYDILNITRSLNPNKADGWDGISARMIKLSDAALITPLKIIFTNCLRRGLFPEIWKYANAVPVYKKIEEKVKGNYRPISLLPIFGKILEKLMYGSYILILFLVNY